MVGRGIRVYNSRAVFMTAWSFRATIAAVPGTVCNIVLVVTNKVSAPLGVFALWRCFPWREKRRLFVYAFTQLTK